MSLISILLAKLGIWPWTPRVYDLKYPVVAVGADGGYAFAVSRPELLVRPTLAWTAPPEDGAILIDADFVLYVERNVSQRQSDLGWLIRRFTTLLRSPRYKIGLRRCWRSGPVAAHARLAKCQSFASGEDAGFARWEIAKQTTMAGIVAVVNRNIVEPPEPAAPSPPADMTKVEAVNP